MKSSQAGGPSKNASHGRSAREMSLLWPSWVIPTCRTPGGNAPGFGNRTGWLRFVVKTVERVI